MNAAEDQQGLLEVHPIPDICRRHRGALAGTLDCSLDLASIVLFGFRLGLVSLLLLVAWSSERVSVLHIANNINFIPRPI